MAALNFPNSPNVDDIHTENGVSFKWNGTIWKKVGSAYTDTTNLNVTGIGTFAGAVNIAGVLTYEDVKNVDSVGIITAREGLQIADNKELKIGAAPDLYIKHSVAHGNNFIVSSVGDIEHHMSSSKKIIKGFQNSGNAYVSLFYNNSEKFATNNTGIDVSGDIDLDNGGSAGINFKRNGTLKSDIEIGSSSDQLAIRARGSSGFISFHTNTSTVERLRISSNGRISIGEDNLTQTATSLNVTRNSGGTVAGESVIAATMGDNTTMVNAIFSVRNAGNRGNRGNSGGSKLASFEFNDKNAMTIDKFGSVGIGTDSPDGSSLGSNTGLVHLKDIGSGNTALKVQHGSVHGYFAADDDDVTIAARSNHFMQFQTNSAERLRIGADGEVSLRRGGISANPAFEIYGSGNAGDATADNLRFQTWGNSSGDYWQIGVNSGLNSAGNNQKASNTLKGAAIRLNAKNGTVTLVTSPANTSTTYEGLTQNEEGHVTMPQQPYFKVNKTGRITGTGVVIWNDEVYDNGSNYDTSNGRFTAPTAGLYWFSCKINAYDRCDFWLQKNGTRFERGQYNTDSDDVGWWSNQLTSIVELSANDYVEVNISSLNQNSDPGEWVTFMGYLIC